MTKVIKVRTQQFFPSHVKFLPEDEFPKTVHCILLLNDVKLCKNFKFIFSILLLKSLNIFHNNLSFIYYNEEWK